MKKVLILSSLLLSLGAFSNENVNEFAEIPEMEQPTMPHHTLAETVLKAVKTYTHSQEKIDLAAKNVIKAQEKANKAQEGLNALYNACAFVVKNVPAPAQAPVPVPVPQDPAASASDLPKTDL